MPFSGFAFFYFSFHFVARNLLPAVRNIIGGWIEWLNVSSHTDYMRLKACKCHIYGNDCLHSSQSHRNQFGSVQSSKKKKNESQIPIRHLSIANSHSPFDAKFNLRSYHLGFFLASSHYQQVVDWLWINSELAQISFSITFKTKRGRLREREKERAIQSSC